MILLVAALCVSVIVAVVATRAGTGAAAAPVPSPRSAPHAAGTADWIAAIAEGITALTILIVFAQLLLTQQAARIERTRGFQERYQSDEFDSAARRSVGCLRVEDVADCVAVIEAYSNRRDAFARVLPWPDSRFQASVKDLTRTLNFFEEMGTAFNQRQLNKKTVLRSFAVPIIDVFVAGWWLICWERGGRLTGQVENDVPEDGYMQYENMVLGLRKKDPALAIDTALHPNDKVRALCLPKGAGDKVPDPDDALAWATSLRLSKALSTFVARADERVAGRGTVANQLSVVSAELEQLPVLQAGSAGAKPRGWDVFLVPRQIDQACDEDWELRYAEAKWLGKVLERFQNYPSLDVAVARVEELATT